MRILITGSRKWRDRHSVEAAIRDAVIRSGAPMDQVVIVHGGAEGADACADVSATAMGLWVEEHLANWRHCVPQCAHDPVEYCPQAGPRRNQRMVDAGADVCLAFPLADSRGTYDCIRRAHDAGIPVRIEPAPTPTPSPAGSNPGCEG